jgi:hypothetical protein
MLKFTSGRWWAEEAAASEAAAAAADAVAETATFRVRFRDPSAGERKQEKEKENANANANESGSSGGPAELNRGRRVINTYFHVPATMAPPPESEEAPEWESLDALLLHLRTQVV